MSVNQLRYAESFPEEFSIKHKISPMTEKKTFHLHRQLEIVFALSGNLKCRFENSTVDIPQYGIILLDQMNLHYIFKDGDSGNCDRYVLYFSSNYISKLSSPEINLLECFLLCRKRQKYTLAVPEERRKGFIHLMEQMNEFQNNSDPTAPQSFGWNLHIKFLLGQFLLLINQLYIEQYGAASSIVQSQHSDMVYQIYDFIEKYYSEDLNTDEIARQFGISKTQLYYIFKEVSGMTVNDYLVEYRIARAKELLINSTHSVEMISQETGYGNLSSFSRIFKSKTGCSPLQYRKKYLS
ncbi:MAG: helix-turn-helix domain-containing protein [Lachnospiraceae bacterium]